MPKFVHKEMETLYVDELKKEFSLINDLMSNLESLPVRLKKVDQNKNP